MLPYLSSGFAEIRVYGFRRRSNKHLERGSVDQTDFVALHGRMGSVLPDAGEVNEAPGSLGSSCLESPVSQEGLKRVSKGSLVAGALEKALQHERFQRLGVWGLTLQGAYAPSCQRVASQACHCLPGGFTLPHCICQDARTGARAHVHGQPRARQFRV